MKKDTIEEWNSLYKTAEPVPPARILCENLHLLPSFPQSKGRALDIACGLAESSFLLAKHGFQVDAWDNSKVAVERVNQKAKDSGLSVNAKVKDVINNDFPECFYDVIIMTHYLEQSISAQIISALKPGGLLFFQTYIREKTTNSGPEDEKYRLKRNELLSMFSELKILLYREEGLVGNTALGFRNEAILIGQK